MLHHKKPIDSEDSSTEESVWSETGKTSHNVGNEPIAIVGMSCRLPGNVRSASDLWKMLTSEQSGQCDAPKDRFNGAAFYHPHGGERAGSMLMKGGYFIQEDVRQFENGFFGINNLEATFMDPQQRKLLEVVYECFESAGETLHGVSGANIGVYCGNFTSDQMTIQSKDPEYFHRYNMTGMGTTILANRISHVFNLQGPSVVLDTACSSSLYALHMACAALDAAECDAAIVCGTNLIFTPEQHIGIMKAGVLSPTSTCHTFDASADGYGRAEGVSAIYLKRLSRAVGNNDPVRSVIRGTAINSNGKTNGITLPSSHGQEAVIRKAYQKAGLDTFSMHETAYVECHGTGTPVGDPIEVEAVSRVFGHESRKLLIGSVKTNLGHSEAASGMSSILKTTMALETGQIPATIGIRNVNPKIKCDEWGVKIVTEMTPYPVGSKYLNSRTVSRAGVNSFGYGGANAHAVLESSEMHVPLGYQPSREKSLSQSLARTRFLLPVSASNDSALRAVVEGLAAYDSPNKNVYDLAYTLSERRSRLARKGYLLAGQKTLDVDLQLEGLRTLGGDSICLPLGFVFTGQGAQWAQMGNELLDEFPGFRDSIQQLDEVLHALPEAHAPSWTLVETIRASKEDSPISRATHSQPICTAIQIALVDLLASWGIVPAAVVGHSSGEIAAAYAAGLVTATEAITIAYYRGYVVGKMDKTTNPGAMMAVGMGSVAADQLIHQLGLQENVRVACINSPESVTISGDLPAIDELLATLQAKGGFARKLHTDGRAYHSHHMLAVGQEYEDLLLAALGHPSPADNRLLHARWMSSVTAIPVDDVPAAAYWRGNLESPVRFSDAVGALLEQEKLHLVEIGSHSALQMPLKQIQAPMQLALPYSSALSRGFNSVETVLHLAGSLFLHGHDVNLARINSVESITTSRTQGKVLTDLPPYPWTYDTLLWHESHASLAFRNRVYPRHDLLGSQVPGASSNLAALWRNILRLSDVPWLQGHRLGDLVVFPAAGFMSMALEAVCQMTGHRFTSTGGSDSVPALALRRVHILKALVLPERDTGLESGVELLTTLRPQRISASAQSETWFEFEISSVHGDKPGAGGHRLTTLHVSGLVGVEDGTRRRKLGPDDSAPELLQLETLAARNWYQHLAAAGLNFGPDFQSLQTIRTDRQKQLRRCEATVEYLRGSDGDGESSYLVHPITFDAMLQAAIIASSAGTMDELGAKVPVQIDSARFWAPSSPTSQETLSRCCIDAVATPMGIGAMKFGAELRTPNGEMCVQIEAARAAPYHGAQSSQEKDEDRHPMLRVVWKPDIERLLRCQSQAASGASAASFEQYLNSFSKATQKTHPSESVRRLAAVLDLLAHRNPRLRIMDFHSEESPERTYLQKVLRAGTAFKRFQSYSGGSLGSVNDNDVVILHPEFTYDEENLSTLVQSLPEGSFVIGRLPTGRIPDIFSPLDFSFLASMSPNRDVFLAQKGNNSITPPSLPPAVILLERDDDADAAFNDQMATRLSERFSAIQRIKFDALKKTDITSESLVIATLELHQPLMATLTNDQMTRLKMVTDQAGYLIWLTAGDVLTGSSPNFALMPGVSRTLMLEQPRLRLVTFSLGDEADGNPESTNITISNIVTTVDDILTKSDVTDLELAQRHGIVHISRFIPEETLNTVFTARQQDRPARMPLSQIKPAHLTIQELGQFDTLVLQQDQEFDEASLQTLPKEYVDVELHSVGLNAKDLYTFAGKVDTTNGTCTLDYAGVVSQVGSAVTTLSVGDRVVVMAPGHFRTTERVPAWACIALRDDEDIHAVATMPTVFSTALYAFGPDRANLASGERVLIHAGAGGLGMAAIQIAQLKGAGTIFTTVSTQQKKDHLVQTFGLNPENIFNSRDVSFQEDILAATGGVGVDVVLNSLTGDLLHASWRCVAPFGRFVEVGKRDLTEAGQLDMQVFLRNVTYTAFDLSELYVPSNRRLSAIRTHLLQEVMSLYRAGRIRPIEPRKVFDISQVTEAFRYFSSKNRIGKVAVSLQGDTSIVKTLPLKYRSQFSPSKTYLLIGCLGGLGRSLARWMVARGARRFVFLGRSGLDKPAAQQLVDGLRQQGVSVQVVRGDVCRLADVEASVRQADANPDAPLGGVIQAAMGLHEALWTAMSNEAWHAGIDPKVTGTWNLHNSLPGHDSALDFFLMSSSVSGSVGTATESNYCAGNYFLDQFARYRRALGLPAATVGLGMLSEVGYLHEHPEIEALLLRKGLQAINEGEMLQIIDLAVSESKRQLYPSEDQLLGDYAYDQYVTSHVLTGLEALGLKAIRQQGFDRKNPVTQNDARARLLNAHILDAVDSEPSGVARAARSGSGSLSAELAVALESGNHETIITAIQTVIRTRFSDLVLLPMNKIDGMLPLPKFGMDSMLAAEFRTWLYQTFKVDVPFLTLLSEAMTLNGLAHMVGQELKE